MNPVMQTRFGNPDGNCWEACLASILEVPIEDVPDSRDSGGLRTTLAGYRTWVMEKHSKLLVRASPQDIGPRAIAAYHIYSFESLRGNRHAVVARGGTVVHDPSGLEMVSIARPLASDFLIDIVQCGTPR